MTAPDAILRAIDLVEERLHQPVTVAAMAEAAGYSLYHFCRVFSKYTRHTPYDYLMRRRMTLAATEVVMTQRKIVDIALEFQFESHEGFTRAFQRMFGAAPVEARKQGCLPASRLLPRLSKAHLICLHQHNSLIPQFVLLPETDCPHLIPPLAPHSNGQLAVSLKWPDSNPSRMSNPLPAGEYARFTLTILSDDFHLILDWVLHTWLFFAPYDLRLPAVLLQNTSLYVPVQNRTAA